MYQYNSRKFNTWRSQYRIHSILHVWLVVSTPLKNNSQNGNLPQIGMKMKKYLKPPASNSFNIACVYLMRIANSEKKKPFNGPQAFLLCSCCRPFHWRSHVKGHSCHHPPTLRRGKTNRFFCDQLGLKSLQVCGRAGFVYRLGVFVSLTQTKSAFSCFSIFQFSVSKNCESECHWGFFQRTKMGSYYLLACSPNVHQQASC